MGRECVFMEYIYSLHIISHRERERCVAMSEATAETSGRGRLDELLRDALKGRRPSGGSDGRGSEKNRPLFPDGGRSERIAEGGTDESPG